MADPSAPNRSAASRKSPIHIPTTAQGSYFARGQQAAFNLTNLVEDTVESLAAFLLRYAYTNCLILWSPRALVFHILKRNRWFLMTRPYSYCFASFFVVVVVYSVFDTFLTGESSSGSFLQSIFGQHFSLSEFEKSPSASALLLASAPALLSLFVMAWLGAAAVSLILVPRRRLRRLFAPVYFGMAYLVGFLLMTLGLLPVAVYGVYQVVPHDPPFMGPQEGVLALTAALLMMSIILIVALAVTAGRTIVAFAAVAGRPKAMTWGRRGRLSAAWLVAFCSLWGAVVLSRYISIGVRVATEGPSPPAAASHRPLISCFNSNEEDKELAGGGPSLTVQQSPSRNPLLGHVFKFVVMNDGEEGVDLQESLKVDGRLTTCKNLQDVGSCKPDPYSSPLPSAIAKIIEPQPAGGAVIVPPKSMVGISVQVGSLMPSAATAQFVSNFEFRFNSGRFPGFMPTSGNSCKP
jgi:hypothetical protein